MTLNLLHISSCYQHKHDLLDQRLLFFYVQLFLLLYKSFVDSFLPLHMAGKKLIGALWVVYR